MIAEYREAGCLPEETKTLAGDSGRGLFIQITDDDVHDVAIPDELGLPASVLTFGILKAAQAAGDRQSMISAGRRVIRFRLGQDVVSNLRKLA